MNKNLGLLLKLDQLVRLDQRLELAGPYFEEPGFEYLEQEIEKLRRQLPGPLLSKYERLARRYANPVAALADGVCQGCQREASTGLAVMVARLMTASQCEHCRRFLVIQQDVPEYVLSL